MIRLFLLAPLLSFQAQRIAEVGCPCDPAKPETMELRQCSLCAEAERQPTDVEIFFLRDASPRKPNRWLALVRTHDYDGALGLARMPHRLRTRLWEAAIRKARDLWGEEWGLAYNGDQVRTQCHLHVHIGKLLKGVETDRAVRVVNGPAEIPVLKDGSGLWIHPHGRKLHVHLKEQICETVLMR
ncbi:MAG: hypothetical protein RMI94_01445 [Bryobacterales bacterium]|nr:hypothetical protein [Bryobacteraceae bacterium]MDW8129187.1 hypothetical protein [Bryobacterales bacterium]